MPAAVLSLISGSVPPSFALRQQRVKASRSSTSACQRRRPCRSATSRCGSRLATSVLFRIRAGTASSARERESTDRENAPLERARDLGSGGIGLGRVVGGRARHAASRLASRARERSNEFTGNGRNRCTRSGKQRGRYHRRQEVLLEEFLGPLLEEVVGRIELAPHVRLVPGPQLGETGEQ